MAMAVEQKIGGELKHCDVVICPPEIFLDKINLDHSKLGAQDLIPGAEALHVQYVIVGHSERRLNLGETDFMVNAKIKEAIKNNITPILCLAENVDAQFTADTKGLDENDLQKIVYVYEPIWTISTVPNSQPVPADEANKMIVHIHSLSGAESRVLYGGTVNRDNVHEYAKYPNIDGALVGAASLDPDNFWEVINAFNQA